MALRPCTECGKDASTDARTCPHCGASNPTVGNRQIAIRVGIAVVVVGVILASMNSGSSSASAPPQRDSESDAYYACRDAIRRQLKAPSTADFPFEGDAHMVRAGDTLAFKSYVDAQNSFGAKLRNYWFCAATTTGGTVSVIAATLNPAPD